VPLACCSAQKEKSEYGICLVRFERRYDHRERRRPRSFGPPPGDSTASPFQPGVNDCAASGLARMRRHRLRPNRRLIAGGIFMPDTPCDLKTFDCTVVSECFSTSDPRPSADLVRTKGTMLATPLIDLRPNQIVDRPIQNRYQTTAGRPRDFARFDLVVRRKHARHGKSIARLRNRDGSLARSVSGLTVE
jgi:hypothetical protein